MFFDKIYESWREIQYEKYELILPMVRSYARNGRVLDIGCGKMFFEDFARERSAKFKIISTDIEPPADVLCDGSNLPFKKAFDVVLAIDSLHKFDPSDVKRVLKDNGVFIAALPKKFEGEFKKVKMRIVDCRHINGREEEIVKVFSHSLQRLYTE